MTPKHRWHYYRCYGISRNLSDEDAEDFASDAYVAWLKADCEVISLRPVLADYMRYLRGRTGGTKHKTTLATNSLDIGDVEGARDLPALTVREELEAVSDYAMNSRMHTHYWVTRLADHLEIDSEALEDILAAMALHPQSDAQRKHNRHVRESARRKRQ